MISTAKSRSLPATARPRAQEFTTRIVSTLACAEKKSPANWATSRWSTVGNLSGEIINCAIRPQWTGLTAARTFSRPNETELSHRWRKRALLRSLELKSCENYSSERPAVGWSDWLGLWGV